MKNLTVTVHHKENDMKPSLIAALLFAVLVIVFAPYCYGQGYYLTEIKEVEKQQTYKEQTGTQEVDVYEEKDGESVVTGTKSVPTYTTKVRRWKALESDLQDKRLHRRMGAVANKSLVHVARGNNLDTAKLVGRSPREIARKAINGNLRCQRVIKQIIWASWLTGKKDEDGNPIYKRDTLGVWLKAGKPKLATPWCPVHVFMGVACPMPNREEMEALIKSLK